MKRLLGLLLVMGMVGCGGGDTSSLPKATTSPRATTPNLPPAYRALQKIPNTRIDLTAEGEIEVVSLMNNRATDETLQLLDGLTHLKNLALGSNQITDAGLVNLKGLINLQMLRLGQPFLSSPSSHACSKVTDAGLVHLKELINLQTLSLAHTQVTDAGLVHLKGMSSLKELDLIHTKVSDAGLVHLKKLTNLQSLGLRGTQITDGGMVGLAGMNLKTLEIPTQARTDAGLQHSLAAIETCKDLSLANWKISDAGLVHLKGMSSLKELDLKNTNVSAPGWCISRG